MRPWSARSFLSSRSTREPRKSRSRSPCSRSQRSSPSSCRESRGCPCRWTPGSTSRRRRRRPPRPAKRGQGTSGFAAPRAAARDAPLRVTGKKPLRERNGDGSELATRGGAIAVDTAGGGDGAPSFPVTTQNVSAAALDDKEDGPSHDGSAARAIALAMQRGQRRFAWCTTGIVALAFGCGAHGGDDAASASAAVTVDQHLAVAIVHADGSAVAWAWLEITGADGSSVAQGNSPNGTFSLALPSGSYQLHAFDGSLAVPVRSLDLTIDRSTSMNSA